MRSMLPPGTGDLSVTKPLHPVVRALKQRRLDLGLTQREVAERIGVKQPCVSAWESGDRHPGLATIQKWANALDMALTVVPMDQEDW